MNPTLRLGADDIDRSSGCGLIACNVDLELREALELLDARRFQVVASALRVGVSEGLNVGDNFGDGVGEPRDETGFDGGV